MWILSDDFPEEAGKNLKLDQVDDSRSIEILEGRPVNRMVPNPNGQ
jgi:hypothetical protein